MSRQILDIGLQIIKSFEGLRLKSYPDPGSGGEPWTVGYGATGPGIYEGVVWTQEQADTRLQSDVARFSSAVENFLSGVDLSDEQFSALVSFAYNVGGWRSSTLFRFVGESKFGDAAEEFPKWCHSGTAVLQGLLNRRNCEKALFVGDLDTVNTLLAAQGS